MKAGHLRRAPESATVTTTSGTLLWLHVPLGPPGRAGLRGWPCGDRPGPGAPAAAVARRLRLRHAVGRRVVRRSTPRSQGLSVEHLDGFGGGFHVDRGDGRGHRGWGGLAEAEMGAHV